MVPAFVLPASSLPVRMTSRAASHYVHQHIIGHLKPSLPTILVAKATYKILAVGLFFNPYKEYY
ncbi:MAG: hypothetical protein JWQ09_3825 [Segetibacter sp.]|nr:hypothetical protein [Segetibacter sp.]